jgi:hypothetical protein
MPPILGEQRITVLRNVRVIAWASAMLLSLHFMAGWAAQGAQYNVTLDFKEPLRAIVQATLVVPDGKYLRTNTPAVRSGATT